MALYRMCEETRAAACPIKVTGLAALLVIGLARPLLAADAALGEYLSSECVGCHQATGATAGGVPSIVGLPRNAFVNALKAYKTGQRDSDVMRNIAARLSDEEMEALAAYFALKR
jgi:cytochrome c553